MPVEIKELVIRAVAVDDSVEDSERSVLRSASVDQEALIEECVRQVLKILKRSKER
jgi:plasmid stability protein